MKAVLFSLLVFVSIHMHSQGSGNVLSYNGSTQYIDLGSLVSGNCRTLEFWFKPNVTITSAIPDAVSLIIRDYLNGSGLNTNEFGFYFTPGAWNSLQGGKLTWYRRVGNTLFYTFSNANSWQANVWYHVAGVIDPVSGMKMYVNGVLQTDTDPTTQPIQVQTGAATDMIAIATWGYWGATTGNRFFNGDIDEVRFWTTARTQTEVRNNMCMIINPAQTGLQGYYRFDGNATTVLADLTGNNYNGTLVSLPANSWHYSSAPLGDTSAYVYPSSWTAQTLTLQYAPGDAFSVSNVTASPDGAHIYRVNSLPNMTTGLGSPLPNYYGVFLTGTSGNYDILHDFSSFSSFCSAPCQSYATRNDNASTPWNTITPVFTNCTAAKTNESTNGVSYREEYILTVSNTIPPNILGNDTALCSTQSYLLNATVSGGTYLWNTNATSSSITVSGAGIYWVDVTVNGCTLRDSITISTGTPPQITLGNDTALCQGLPLTLSPGFTNATGYLWSTFQTTSSISVSTSGTYSVDVNVGGCHATDTINVLFLPSPVFSLGNDTALCNTSSLTLNTVSGAGAYQWSTGDFTSFITVSSSGTYSVIVTDNGCSYSDAINVTFSTVAIPNLGSDTTVCPGDTVFYSMTDPSSSYVWSDGGTDLTMTVTGPGSYWVTSQSGSCVLHDTITVSYLNQLSLGPDMMLCDITSGIMLDPGTSSAVYTWSTNDTTQNILITQPGIYWVSVSNSQCTIADTIEISGDLGGGAVYLPNSFTPNGDGKNEVYNVVCSSLTSLHMEVFNRWGQLVFETRDIYEGWNGKYKGEVVAGDVFVVRITYTTSCSSEEEFTKLKHVNVIR